MATSPVQPVWWPNGFSNCGPSQSKGQVGHIRLADCVLMTMGGLVFGGSGEGNFYALDAMTGKPLWDFQTGGYIAANPISFLVEGKQQVAIAAGQALFVFCTKSS